jgi:mannosylglycerate hydrolase
MAEQLNIIVVPHTHWDREWYQTFQQFRMRLVRAVDKLLDILDRDPNFSYFMLDGQTIVLDDYLEVRPEQEDRLKHYTRSGRITVGPWYLQPDEFLVSGESLVRNLQIGLQRTAEFGEPMLVGYLPDCFGHIAQLPQILRGFGIDSAVFWRGVGSDAQKSEFYWVAPDGTRVLVVHLADPRGYSNAAIMPLSPQEFTTRVELLTANLLPKITTNTLLFMNGSDHLEPQDGLPTAIASANTLLSSINPEHEKILARYRGQDGNIPQINGIHLRIGTLTHYIDAVRQHCEHPNATALQTLEGEMRSSQYSHLLPAVLSTRMWIKQQNTAIEHLLERWVEPLTAWAWQLGSPYPQGLVRLAWKYLLQNHPHDSICGCSIDQVHRENSVRFAQSQQVGEGVVAQAIQNLVSATNTQAPFPVTHPSYEPIPIVVFNPAPGPRTAGVQVVVQVPGSLRNAVIVDEQGEHMLAQATHRWKQELGMMPVPRETLAAAVALAGLSTPGQLTQMAHSMLLTALGLPEDSRVITHMHLADPGEVGLEHLEIMIAPRGRVAVNEQELHAAEQQILAVLGREDVHTLEVSVVDQVRETIDFVATGLPAYGLKTFWLYPRGLRGDKHTPPDSTVSGQQAPHPFIENEFYRVEANEEDGTLTVIDKQTGAIFPGLNRFVDGGDVGDLYTYCPPAQDSLISAPIEPPKIELVSDGPVHAILRIRGRWALPTSCTPSRAERSSRTTICGITSEVTLIPGLRRIDIHTSVENLVKDHRLRVHFPLPYSIEHADAEGTFEVRSRPVAAPHPADVAEWAELPVHTFPQKRFVDASNGTLGLGILNRGLPEYEVVQNEHATTSEHSAGQQEVALTLLRCVDWLSRGDLTTRRGHAGPMEHTPEAQCLGHQEFDYALVLHSGNWDADQVLVLREAQAFNTPVRAAVTEQHSGQLPTLATLVEVEPRELVVSAIKRSNSGEGLIVRVYNPLSHAVEASLRPGMATSKAFVANLQEKPQEQLFWSGTDGEPIHVGMRSGEILTVLFTRV